jgi:hypothetical protein
VTYPSLVAVGWATVDVERAVAAWPSDDLRPLPDDPDLGARAVAIEGVEAVVLLEPITEGRLAAALARHGEGPIAVYLRPPAGAAGSPITARRSGSGPFGRQALVGRGRSFGPFVIAVLDDLSPDTIGA